VTPTNNALLSLATPAEAQGEILGLSQGMAGLGRMVGPMVAGWLFGIGIGLPFFVGAGLVLLALLVALPRVGNRSPIHAGEPETLQSAQEAATVASLK
jgi:MFS family permease